MPGGLERRVSTCAPLPHRDALMPLPLKVLHPDEFSHTVLVMVGLPARGKTYISKKITRYLNWVGINTRVFNVGEYRRKATDSYKNHNFFERSNTEAQIIRQQAASDALEDLTFWLSTDGEIAVFDATNTTRERREWIVKHCREKMLQVLFVESICDDQKIIDESIREVKISSPDYVDMDKDEAVADFVARIKHYEDYYEPIDEKLDKHLSFIKIFNQGEKYLVNRVQGNVLSRIVYYLMNIRVTHRTIYLTRHGESELNLLGRIGGDADLSAGGRAYSKKLAEYIESENIDNLKVWTSHFKRTIQTAQHLKEYIRIEHWKALNEIDAGECEGMTYEEIQEKFPVDFAKRDEDKYHYRYHMGESYQDLVARLEPVIMELERQNNVLVICHQAVARCLIAYFMDKNKEELPYVKVPLHTVLKLTPAAYGCHIEYVDLNIPAVDTHRDKPDVTDVDRPDISALSTVPFHY